MDYKLETILTNEQVFKTTKIKRKKQKMERRKQYHLLAPIQQQLPKIYISDLRQSQNQIKKKNPSSSSFSWITCKKQKVIRIVYLLGKFVSGIRTYIQYLVGNSSFLTTPLWKRQQRIIVLVLSQVVYITYQLLLHIIIYQLYHTCNQCIHSLCNNTNHLQNKNNQCRIPTSLQQTTNSLQITFQGWLKYKSYIITTFTPKMHTANYRSLFLFNSCVNKSNQVF
eukprot:TRINITY_DN1459_c0_g1_i3.p2 TRINITY_DN1459_c0_g1~~TRINITY_DN1459_c0_g1_i3.p2  ORF type:complete len:224 (+),score=-14.90 TRINITY_DN1459_c0_g1_i3:898-1569(+)